MTEALLITISGWRFSVPLQLARDFSIEQDTWLKVEHQSLFKTTPGGNPICMPPKQEALWIPMPIHTACFFPHEMLLLAPRMTLSRRSLRSYLDLWPSSLEMISPSRRSFRPFWEAEPLKDKGLIFCISVFKFTLFTL